MGDSSLPLSIVKVNQWMNDDESNLKINVVEDDRVESFMENIHEEGPSIGCMVLGRQNSQTSGSEFSYDSPPSYCDVAPRCESPTSMFMFPTSEEIPRPISLSISSTVTTDETFDSSWYDLHAPRVEALRLNLRSQKYELPHFIRRMHQLKVLNITGCGVYPSELQNLPSVVYLSNLKRIRFKRVSFSSSIRPIFALHNLKELAFILCDLGDAFMSCTTESSYILRNLTELVIDRCYDLKELPSELCSLVQLKKLSITNCHELETLSKELGSLSNLEILSLHCCTKLQEIPGSIGSLNKLRFIDISDCFSISILPQEIGELIGLKVFKMSGCRALQELPISISKLLQLEDVICDEETSYLWMNFERDLYNLKINVVENNKFETFMNIIQ